MNTTDIIGVVNAVAQFAVAGVAIWAVWASLHANKRQIGASEIQINKQIEENRRLATEERHHQSRPIIVPEKEISHNTVTYFSTETGKANESLYTPEHRIDWSWPHEIRLIVRNMGSGPAFNLHCVLYGPENTCQSQFVSWDAGPIEEKSSTPLELVHSSELRLSPDDSVDGKHPLYDRSLDSPSNPWTYRTACLTMTYHDLFEKKHVSIFHYTLQHRWIHVATEVLSGEHPFDLKELNDQKKQGPKWSAPPISYLQGH